MTAEILTFNVLLAQLGSEDGSNLGRCFDKLGWDCTRVTGVEESIKAVDKSKFFDLIVSDVQLPVGHCVQWLRSIKDRNPKQAVVIVAEAHTLDDAMQYLRAGATDFVKKPLDYSLFEQVVTRVAMTLREENLGRRHESLLNYDKRVYEGTTADFLKGKFRLDVLYRLREIGRIDASTCYQLTLAFQEALTNSLEHGNLGLESKSKDQLNEDGTDEFARLRAERLDDAKYRDRPLTVTTEYENGVLNLQIQDSGDGFDPGQKEREIREHLNTHGRGLPIIFGILDKVAFDKGGTRITLVKRLE